MSLKISSFLALIKKKHEELQQIKEEEIRRLEELKQQQKKECETKSIQTTHNFNDEIQKLHKKI